MRAGQAMVESASCCVCPHCFLLAGKVECIAVVEFDIFAGVPRTDIKGQALYDFDANEEHGELSLTAGDIVTVHRQFVASHPQAPGCLHLNRNCGDFDFVFIQSLCSHFDISADVFDVSATGLFPASYVQLSQGTGQDFDEDEDGSDWEDSPDEWDDDAPGMDDDPGKSSSSMSPTQAHAHATTYGGSASSYGRAGTLKKSMYRFSVFVKAGAEAFLIGATKDVTIDANNMLHIQETRDGPSWVPNPSPYNEIDVQHDGSRSKYKGIKTYEAYNISNAGPGVQVERRYKHFIWLHDRLVEKYSCICVPPLPAKDYNQKFGETLTEKREQRLKMWINRLCRHPVLSRDAMALQHFLTCPTSDKTLWKNGKRKAEKDQFVNSLFFKLISQDVPCPNDSDKEIEQFEKFVSGMMKAVKVLEFDESTFNSPTWFFNSVKRNTDIASRFSDRMAGSFRNEFSRVAQGMELLGQTFSHGGGQVSGDFRFLKDQRRKHAYALKLCSVRVFNSVRLSAAFVAAAACVNNIADMYAMQPRHDQIPWIEGLKEYQGLLSQFSGCIVSSRSASMRLEEIDNNEEAKPGEKDAVRSRCDVIHTVALCEMSHFHQQRRSDFRDMMKEYFAAQIEFHQKIMEQLAAAKAEFDKLEF
eukprot:gene1382-4558_t